MNTQAPPVEKRENLSIVIKHQFDTEEKAKNPLVQVASTVSDDTQMIYMVKRAAYLYLASMFEPVITTDEENDQTTLLFYNVTDEYPLGGKYTLKEFLVDIIFKDMDNVKISTIPYITESPRIPSPDLSDMLSADKSGYFFPLAEVNKKFIAYISLEDFGFDIRDKWNRGIEKECLRLAYRFLEDYHAFESSWLASSIRMDEYNYFERLRLLCYIGVKALDLLQAMDIFNRGFTFCGTEYISVSEFYKKEGYLLEYMASEFFTCLVKNPGILLSLFLPDNEAEETLLHAVYRTSNVTLNSDSYSMMFKDVVIDDGNNNVVSLITVAEAYFNLYTFRYSAYGLFEVDTMAQILVSHVYSIDRREEREVK